MPQVPDWAQIDAGDAARSTAIDDDPVFELDLGSEAAADDVDPVFTLADAAEAVAVAPADVPAPPQEPDFDAVAAHAVDDEPRLDPRWLWRVAIVLLVLTTAAALAAVGIRVAPAAARGVGNGASWAVGGVGDGAREAGDALDRWTGSLTAAAAAATQVEPGPIAAPEGSRSALIVVSDAEGRGVAFALLARPPEGSATLALVPPGLLAVQPGFGDFPLSQATIFADAELAALTLTNLLGIRIDDVVWLEQGDLAGALPGDVDLDLPVPLIVAEGDEGRVLAKSGRAERLPAVIEAIMATQGMSDQLEWMQRQGAVWSAVLAAAAENPEIATMLAAGSGTPEETGKLLTAAAQDGALTVTAVPVTQVALGRSGDGYTLASDIAEPFVEQRFGHLALRPGERPRVELLNGNGRVGATRLLAQELVRRGYRVVKTDNASNFDYEITQVISQGRTHRVDAQAVLDLLGSGELLLEVRAPSGVVDISIIVGQDVPTP